MKNFLWVFASLFLSFSVFAFENAYVSFDAPENWECELSDGVWICQGTQETDKKESIVLSIAATASQWDSLENYEEHLKKQRQIEGEDGKLIDSEVRYTRRRKINGIDWIDSLQLNSEVPGFWTRYSATVQQLGEHRLAILITYIVSQENYNKMAPAFEKMVSSLKTKTKLEVAKGAQKGDENFQSKEVLGATPTHLGKLLKDRLNTERQVSQTPPPPTYGTQIFLLLGALGAGYFLWKRKQQKKSKLPAEPKQ